MNKIIDIKSCTKCKKLPKNGRKMGFADGNKGPRLCVPCFGKLLVADILKRHPEFKPHEVSFTCE